MYVEWTEYKNKRLALHLRSGLFVRGTLEAVEDGKLYFGEAELWSAGSYSCSSKTLILNQSRVEAFFLEEEMTRLNHCDSLV